MINTLWGSLLLLAPFLLIFCFTDRLKGFWYILTADLAWHLFLSLTTQFLHIFSYPIITGLHTLTALAVILVLIKKAKGISFKLHLNWLAILAFSIIIFELWSVHYFYSGSVSNNVNRYQAVSRASYPYPYFSDEWVGVSIVKYCIANNALPIINPLINRGGNQDFPNIFIAFFSVLSEIFLLVNLNPLTGYAIFSLASGALICLLVYTLLRINGLRPGTAILGALFLPYIVNSQNLTGIWYLIPIIGGLIPWLLSLGAFKFRDFRLAWINSFLALLLYPPLIFFVLPTCAGGLLLDKKIDRKMKTKLIFWGISIFAGAAALIIFLQGSNLAIFTKLVKSYFIYPSLDNGIPFLPIWLVVPWIILPFSALGMIMAWRKKMFYLVAPLSAGLLLWLIYSRSLHLFIIGYDRTVLTSSILLTVVAALGWDYLTEKLIRRFPILVRAFLNREILIFTIAIFGLLSWSYTQQATWEKFTLKLDAPDGVRRIKPLAPATDFLTAADLKLFQPLSGKRFLSDPWKGLVIGAATGNYPLDSKHSIISNQFLSFNLFMAQDCDHKKILAEEYQLEYLYAPALQCLGFDDLGMSDAGLHLYRFNKPI